MEIDSIKSDDDGPVYIAKTKRQGKMFSSVFSDLLLGSDLFTTTIQSIASICPEYLCSSWGKLAANTPQSSHISTLFYI